MTIPVAELSFDRMPPYIDGAKFEDTKIPPTPVLIVGYAGSPSRMLSTFLKFPYEMAEICTLLSQHRINMTRHGPISSTVVALLS